MLLNEIWNICTIFIFSNDRITDQIFPLASDKSNCLSTRFQLQLSLHLDSDCNSHQLFWIPVTPPNDLLVTDFLLKIYVYKPMAGIPYFPSEWNLIPKLCIYLLSSFHPICRQQLVVLMSSQSYSAVGHQNPVTVGPNKIINNSLDTV